MANKLKESAKCTTDWYDNNLLEGNLDKYQTMYITKKYLNKDKNKPDKDDQSNNPNTSRPASINLKKKKITISDSLKILGVDIDSNLNFNNHVINVCKKASQRVGVIMRLRNLIPTISKLVRFKTAIIPYSTYCHLVWHFCRASDTLRIKRIQERGLRAVFKDAVNPYVMKKIEIFLKFFFEVLENLHLFKF